MRRRKKGHDAARIEVESDLTGMAGYVETIAKGDETLLASSGFELRGAAAVLGILAAPAALTATLGDKPGAIDLSWDRTRGVRTYVVQSCDDPISDAGWKQIALLTKSKMTVPELPAGKRTWFRVAAIGTAGQSAWSDPVGRMAT